MNLRFEKLFSYGTLRYETVQIATFGRKLNGTKDVLLGYRLSTVKITELAVVEKSGEAVHLIAIPTVDKTQQIEGVVFDITKEELSRADQYEVSDYKRVKVRLASGAQAWAYVSLSTALDDRNE